MVVSSVMFVSPTNVLFSLVATLPQLVVAVLLFTLVVPPRGTVPGVDRWWLEVGLSTSMSSMSSKPSPASWPLPLSSWTTSTHL